MLASEFVDDSADNAVVEVDAAEEGVTTGSHHLEDFVADLDDRDVEGTATEIVDREALAQILAQPIGERGGRRFVEDSQHLKARDLARAPNGLALLVIEVRWHGDDGVRHFFLKVLLGDLFDLAKDVA